VSLPNLRKSKPVIYPIHISIRVSILVSVSGNYGQSNVIYFTNRSAKIATSDPELCARFYLGCRYQRIRNDVALNSQKTGIRALLLICSSHTIQQRLTIWSREVNTHSDSHIIPSFAGRMKSALSDLQTVTQHQNTRKNVS
jgi:hypothetical protein